VAFPDWIDPYFVGSVNPEGIPHNTQTHRHTDTQTHRHTDTQQ